MKSTFDQAKQILHQHQITIAHEELEKPWGGFLVINPKDLTKFVAAFFNDAPPQLLTRHKNQPLSPKFLIVFPDKRLSWQYHHRRSEIWKVLVGKVNVATSFTDIEEQITTYEKNQIIVLEQEQRHRLIGLEKAAIVAEIWQHTNVAHLSDEKDIVRVQDDFGRK